MRITRISIKRSTELELILRLEKLEQELAAARSELVRAKRNEKQLRDVLNQYHKQYAGQQIVMKRVTPLSTVASSTGAYITITCA